MTAMHQDQLNSGYRHDLPYGMVTDAPSISAPTPFKTLLWRGFKRACPKCGQSHLFQGYLKLRDCDACGNPTSQMRADDFPPYITMIVVGHVVVPLLLIMERTIQPSMTLQLGLWIPLSGAMIYFLLPRFKGLVVGWMLYLGLTGDETQ